MRLLAQVHRRVVLLSTLCFFELRMCDHNSVMSVSVSDNPCGLHGLFRRHASRDGFARAKLFRKSRCNLWLAVDDYGMSSNALEKCAENSDKEGLQCGREGGDGRKGMLLEGLFQVCQRELGWAVRDDARWLAQSSQRGSDSGLRVNESSPDMIGG